MRCTSPAPRACSRSWRSRSARRCRRTSPMSSSGQRRPDYGKYERSRTMLAQAEAFSGFAVPDIAVARRFYGETLGVETEILDEENGLMALHHPGGRDTLIYVKPDHQPASYTILNFRVDDIDSVVDGLTERGVKFERYEDFPQDEKGIMRGRAANRGPDVAWFTDPAGNILSVLQE